MHPHCLIFQHGAECLWAWQLDWAQRGHNICIFSCFHREMGWRGKNVRWVSARQCTVYTYRGGTKEGELDDDTTKHFSCSVLGLNSEWPACGLGLSASRKTLRSFLPNRLLLSYSYAWYQQQQQQPPLTYWVPTVCFTHIPFHPYNNSWARYYFCFII